jgi:anti-sigma factor RsiW
MNCPSANPANSELLLAFSSRKLAPPQAAALERHLAECPACAEFVHRQQALWHTLDRWEAAPISPDFDRRLYQAIEHSPSWWQRLTHSSVPIFATAAAFLVIAGVLLDRSVPPQPDPVPVHAVSPRADSLQAEQVVKALDEMDALNQFNSSLQTDPAQSQM